MPSARDLAWDILDNANVTGLTGTPEQAAVQYVRALETVCRIITSLEQSNSRADEAWYELIDSEAYGELCNDWWGEE